VHRKERYIEIVTSILQLITQGKGTINTLTFPKSEKMSIQNNEMKILK